MNTNAKRALDWTAELLATPDQAAMIQRLDEILLLMIAEDDQDAMARTAKTIVKGCEARLTFNDIMSVSNWDAFHQKFGQAIVVGQAMGTLNIYSQKDIDEQDL